MLESGVHFAIKMGHGRLGDNVSACVAAVATACGKCDVMTAVRALVQQRETRHHTRYVPIEPLCLRRPTRQHANIRHGIRTRIVCFLCVSPHLSHCGHTYDSSSKRVGQAPRAVSVGGTVYLNVALHDSPISVCMFV